MSNRNELIFYHILLTTYTECKPSIIIHLYNPIVEAVSYLSESLLDYQINDHKQNWQIVDCLKDSSELLNEQKLVISH